MLPDYLKTLRSNRPETPSRSFQDSRHFRTHPLSDRRFLLENCLGARNLKKLARAATTKDVERYFRMCRPFYRKHVSDEGFMHIALGNDFYTQAREVMALIQRNNASRILELGCGNGTNSDWLAERFPDKEFYSVDLAEVSVTKPNRFHWRADVRDLPESAFDLVFAIETLCYVDDLAQVLRQFGNTTVVIYDGFLPRPRVELEPEDQELLALMEKGMAVNHFHELGCVPSCVLSEDRTDEALAFLKYLENKTVDFFTSSRLRGRVLRNCLPFSVLKNSVSGLLMYPLFSRRVIQYQNLVLEL